MANGGVALVASVLAWTLYRALWPWTVAALELKREHILKAVTLRGAVLCLCLRGQPE